MERLYTAGFTDPGRPVSRWLRLFTGGARKQAWSARDLVTIGPAGRRLRSLHEREGRLRIRVLLDRHNHPLTAFAAVKFRAVAPIRTGGRLLVVSRGRFFLRSGGHGWVVYGFQVERDDRSKGT
jgi:hypothetical protein